VAHHPGRFFEPGSSMRRREGSPSHALHAVDADPSPERISIARCRELLDEDADAMTNQRKIRCAK
jgi:hypothetical protein